MNPDIPAQPVSPVIPEIQAPVTPPMVASVPEQPYQPKPKLSKWIIVAIAVVIFLLLIVGSVSAYVLSKNFFKTAENLPSPAPVVKTSPTPTPDSTASWKIYKDINYKLSFAYPPDLNIQKIQHDPLGAEILIYDPKIGTKSGTMTGINIYYEMFALYLPEYISFDSLYASASGSIINIYSQVFGNYQLVKNENTTLSGGKAFYYTRTPLPIDVKEPGTGKGVYIKLNSDLVAIVESPENKFENLKQILSTFKITQ